MHFDSSISECGFGQLCLMTAIALIVTLTAVALLLLL